VGTSSNIPPFVNKIITSKYSLILILLTTFVILGLLIADDFGLSWDEYKDMTYGDAVLRAYQGFDDFMWLGLNRRYYGPAYWLIVSLIVKLTVLVNIKVNIVYFWKYICFFVFLMALFFFYILCTKFMKRITALIATSLFAFQPLLFGHAFINQKDIPFMSFFLMSVVVGVIGVDHIRERFVIQGKSTVSNNHPWSETWEKVSNAWMELSRIKRVFLIILLVAFVLLFVEIFFLKAIFLPWMEQLVVRAYEGIAIEPINTLFRRIAQDAYKTPVSMYIKKLNDAYTIGSIMVFLSVLIAVLTPWRNIFDKKRRTVSVVSWIRAHYIFLLAGAILGITTSIRVAGPLAGCIVSVYFLTKLGRRSFFALLLYWFVAIVVSYSIWPFLWDSPIDRFRESLEVAGSFTQRETLFQGEIIRSTKMPWYSLPYLMAIQFTEPFIMLFLTGSIASLNHIWNRKKEWFLLLLILLWLGLPLLAIILLQIPFYDNFRQFLFLVPPAILIAGMGIKFVYERINSKIVKTILLIMILAPGLIGIIQLHPYEYIYYNSFIGTVDHVYRRFEVDYWCTSLRESIDFLNKSAPYNSSVVILGPTTAAIPFARKDLKINDTNIFGDELDYVITCRYAIWEDTKYSDSEVIYEVRRGNGILAQVKAIQD
jgi:hypothetical protein